MLQYFNKGVMEVSNIYRNVSIGRDFNDQFIGFIDEEFEVCILFMLINCVIFVRGYELYKFKQRVFG